MNLGDLAKSEPDWRQIIGKNCNWTTVSSIVPHIMPTATLWKIACQEDKYPGMWQRWFKNQCVAVGWPAQWGWKLDGSGKSNKGWVAARNALEAMSIGDRVIVALRGNRIGRMAEIVGKQIADDEWNPLVPVGPRLPFGEMGRRIPVRWELTTGPDDRGLVIQMPSEHTLTSGELRPTVSRIRSHTIGGMRSIMCDPKNWVGLLGKFGYEKALSDYIATYPQHLEDGLLPHPNARIREMVFTDRKRMDVLLIDRDGTPVIVECKQHSPYAGDIKQLRHYMKRFHEKTKESARGILVHGGARIVSPEVTQEAQNIPAVKIVSYRLQVDFLS